ncbi:MAG: hypothetical protein ACFCVB_21060 [Nodosilinea sp.]
MSTQNIDPDNRNKAPNPKPFEATVNSRPVTPDEIAYRDGYVRGKSAEQLEADRRRAVAARRHEENARLRADNGVSTGVILGFVLAAVATIFGGVLYLYNNNDSQSPVDPTPEATSPEPAHETTIIERTIERTQAVIPAPAPSRVEPPQIKVEVTPAPAPAPAPAPDSQAQPEQPATQPSRAE